MDDSNRPATKQEVIDASDALRKELRKEFVDANNALGDGLVEVIRDTGTKLLNAFCTFAKSNQAPLRENDAETAGIQQRLSIVDLEVERRLNMPPPA